MKIHIVLNRAAVKDPKKKATAVENIKKKTGISEINDKRLSRYGILSGVVDDEQLESIKRITDVESVEVDEEQHAIDNSNDSSEPSDADAAKEKGDA